MNNDVHADDCKGDNGGVGDSGGGGQYIYWQVKFPFPLSNRDVSLPHFFPFFNSFLFFLQLYFSMAQTTMHTYGEKKKREKTTYNCEHKNEKKSMKHKN